MKSLRQIDLVKYQTTARDLDNFRNDLIHVVGNKILEYNTNDELVFGLMSHVKPINQTLKISEKSIEVCAGLLLQHFGLNRNASLYSIGADNSHKLVSSTKNKSSKQKVLDDIFRFKDPPKKEYDRIRNDVYEHLQTITQLVNHYLAQPAVQNYLKEEGRPSCHEDRMILDYYKRCNEAQQIILNYYLGSKIIDRAIYNATKTFMNINLSIKWFDYPYFFFGYNEGYYNHQKLDKSTHRFDGINLPEQIEFKMLEIYNANKRRYYQILFKELPIKKILSDIDFYTNSLPLSEDRKNIINELKFLFSKKRWISFYGIALSQVEGLFLEMVDIAVNKQNIKNKGLSQKVESLRELYALSSYHFDYFQYHIPFLRNKFMHGALNGDEGDKLNSYDFLTDIRFLLKAFSELNNPLIELKKILSSNDFIFHSLSEISKFIKLVNGINGKRKSENWNAILLFFHNNLVENKTLEYLLTKAQETIPEEIEDLSRKFNMIYFDISLQYHLLSLKDLKKILSDENNIKELKSNAFFIEDIVEKINNYYTTASALPKYTKDKNITILTKSVIDNYSEEFKKVFELHKLIS